MARPQELASSAGQAWPAQEKNPPPGAAGMRRRSRSMKTPTILDRSHPSPLGPLHVIRPHRLPPPAEPNSRWICTTRLQGATMSKPSMVFIGHQVINLPHGLTLRNSTGERANSRKSMNLRRYTLYEVTGRKAAQDLCGVTSSPNQLTIW